MLPDHLSQFLHNKGTIIKSIRRVDQKTTTSFIRPTYEAAGHQVVIRDGMQPLTISPIQPSSRMNYK